MPSTSPRRGGRGRGLLAPFRRPAGAEPEVASGGRARGGCHRAPALCQLGRRLAAQRAPKLLQKRRLHDANALPNISLRGKGGAAPHPPWTPRALRGSESRSARARCLARGRVLRRTPLGPPARCAGVNPAPRAARCLVLGPVVAGPGQREPTRSGRSWSTGAWRERTPRTRPGCEGPCRPAPSRREQKAWKPADPASGGSPKARRAEERSQRRARGSTRQVTT
jgi:hypothetical protein